jgi:hypothetical protein
MQAEVCRVGFQNKCIDYVAAVTLAVGILSGMAFAQESGTAPAGANSHPVGSVKAVGDNSLTITTDAGADLTIAVQPATKILEVPAGQRDLKSATPIPLNQVQTGDRALVRGTALADGKLVNAASIIVMKQSEIARKQQQDREDWQKRGVDGTVKSVDATAGTVTISPAPNKTVTVHTTKATIIRRYSPDSVKFDDAKPATLDQIKPGDQFRARGEKSANGMDLNAAEIVSGTFLTVDATVISTDPASNTLTVKDLATKKPVTIKISSDSQLRQLPPMVAQRMAMRIKAAAHGGEVTPATQNTSTGEHGNPAAAAAGGREPGGWQQGERPRGQVDLQQMLSRLPAVSLTDLQKGQAVVVLATEGSASSPPTAITLLTGVEPILTASPNEGHAAGALLSPWSLGGPAGDMGAQ